MPDAPLEAPLEALIARRIATLGPMSVAEYMALCLQHPDHGVYRTDPLGRHFTTAPEISQMFGELVGLWLASQWQGGPVCLAELGPGRGTLMADALRATRGVPGFHDALTLVLVETSPALAEACRARLPNPRIVPRIEDLPDLPLLLVANEFFDALPIRQYVRVEGGWAEQMVGLSGGRLAFGLAPPQPQPFPDAPLGTVREVSPAAEAIAAELGARLAGGAALVIDYGGEGPGDTLQALRDGHKVDPLAGPGTADLTAHVDFGALAGAAGQPWHLTTQGAFLERMGITARAQALARRDPGAAAAHRRLTHPDQMGSLFKVLALGPADPPGFR